MINSRRRYAFIKFRDIKYPNELERQLDSIYIRDRKLFVNRHEKKTRTHGYSFEFVSILTGNTRVWV
ncbi:hypothetical protein HKD37_14G039704 [Glycine soja]